MKKNIAIITTGTLPVPALNGGAVETLTQTFIDLNELNHDFDITVFTIGKSYLTKSILSKYKIAKFICIDEKKLIYRLKKIVRFIINKIFHNTIPNQFISSVLKNKLQLEKADIILVTNNQYYPKYLKKKMNSFVVLHLHNDYLNKDSKRNDSLKYINKVIGVSKFIRNRVAQIAPDTCKVSYVYNGINLKKFNNKICLERQQKIIDKYKINDDDVIFIYSGRIQESKGINFLVESFIDLSKNYDNIKLLVLGGSKFSNSKENSTIKKIRRMIYNKKAVNKIFLTGYIDYEHIQNFYKIASIAVFPSISTEAFGLTSIEAQACGLPVIVSDSGGMSETVSSKSGFIIDRKKNIKSQLIFLMKKLIDNNELRNIMSEEAKANVNFFSDFNFYNKLKFELESS